MMRRSHPSVQDELLRPPVEYDTPRRKDNLFLWTVFLLLLVGFAMLCWIGSYLVFGRPELPMSYKLLRKIKKIDPPKRFAVNAAPPGEFLTPERLYSRYNAMSGPKLRETNRTLERNFLRNYPVSNDLVPYVTGRFTLMDSYELQPTDFVPSGVVSLAVSSDFPRLLIEHLYTSSPQDAQIIKRNLQTGMDVELRRTFELTAVLHVARLTTGQIQLTVVPLNYGRYIFTGANGGFELQPPPNLNVAAGWPVVRGDRLETANLAYMDFRTHAGFGPLVSRTKEGNSKPPLTALKGVDAPIQPASSPPPAVAAASSPAGTPTLAGKPAASPPKPGALVATNKPPPVATPAASASPPTLVAQADLPVAKALPVLDSARHAPAPPAGVIKAAPPSQGLNGGVSLQPFLAGPTGNSAPAATTTSRTWPTYAAGRAPSGKSVHVSEIAALSQRGNLSDEPVYLTGQFVVRAVGENRLKGVKTAVMRSSAGNSNVRVIVEFPSDRALPSEGAEISRDPQRPYQITDVRRVEDGTYNVFAREIAEP